jgi:plasminogen activator
VHAGSDNAMDDFDWLFGYAGFNSWSDWSHHGDTRIGKAYELDVSGALGVFADASTRIEALAGYRLLTLKWNAFGGSFVYSTNGFRDDLGTFPANELQIAYQQWWHAPYLGVAVAHEIGPVRVSAEFAASPLVSARDRDHHVDIAVFKEAFAPSGMASVALSAEWAFADRASLVGRAEFQRFFEARGGIKEIDVDPPGFARYPRPAAGADHESLLLSVGLKARL